MVVATDTAKPPMIARASGAYCSLPASIPRAMGIIPSSVASEVIRIGRRRTLHASMTAARTLMPRPCRMPENSTMRMLFETTMPVIMMTPISDMIFRVAPVRKRMSKTPTSPGGIAVRIMNGSRKERNCAIKMR